MCNSIKNRIFARIYGHGKGWTFSTFDFMSEFKRYEIDCALSSLWRENKIRRICRGIYDYPVYSSILKRNAAPDINAIAAALARKFRWQIYPTGDTALNYFGISTQIPGRTIYLTDGPSRTFELECGVLEFKHSAQKEIVFKYPESALVVQGIRALGNERITPAIIEVLRSKFDAELWRKIKKDTIAVAGWIYETVSKIAGEI
ncbi:MAG: hypothetical protein BWY31_03456 [Lentisphaerae bacterium ADurb.Bin242]|nr:MAG: hypothetical protein BWY31_03456 [Lentisphaerae bacterium ADurb.Bin242]